MSQSICQPGKAYVQTRLGGGKASISTSISARVLALFFFIAIIYNSGYALITVDDSIGIILLCVGTTLSVIAIVTKAKKNEVLNMPVSSYLLVPVGLVSAIMLSMIVNSEYDTWGSYFRLTFVIIFAFCISYLFPFKKFVESFLAFMRVVTIIALCYSFLLNVLKVTIPFPIVTNINNVNYHAGVVVFSQLQSPERSMGVFWEPGLYASFLILGLLCEFLFVEREPKKSNVILFAASIITTFSAAGYVLALFVVLIALNQRSDKSLSPLLNIACMILLVIGLLFSQQMVIGLSKIIPGVFEKMTYASNSLITRTNGPLADLQIFINEPLFGAGIRDYQSLWSDAALRFNLNSRTSTITYFIATIGVAGFLYFFAVVKGVFGLPGVKIVSKFCIAIIMISILSKEPHYYNALMFMIIFYFLQRSAGRQSTCIAKQ